jgi:hypothetical protein
MADEARGGNVVAATANLVLFSTLSWLLDSRHRDDVEELENSDPLSSRTRQKFHSGQKFGATNLVQGTIGRTVSYRNKSVKYGGASRDRTDDLIVANDALSQLSYSPTSGKTVAKILSAPASSAKSQIVLAGLSSVRAMP